MRQVEVSRTTSTRRGGPRLLRGADRRQPPSAAPPSGDHLRQPSSATPAESSAPRSTGPTIGPTPAASSSTCSISTRGSSSTSKTAARADRDRHQRAPRSGLHAQLHTSPATGQGACMQPPHTGSERPARAPSCEPSLERIAHPSGTADGRRPRRYARRSSRQALAGARPDPAHRHRHHQQGRAPRDRTRTPPTPRQRPTTAAPGSPR